MVVVRRRIMEKRRVAVKRMTRRKMMSRGDGEYAYLWSFEVYY
jgi:hypothetical protein